MIESAFNQLFRSKLSRQSYLPQQYDTNSDTKFDSEFDQKYIEFDQKWLKMTGFLIDFNIFD